MKIIDKYTIIEKFYPEILSGIGEIVQKGRIASRFTQLHLQADKKIILNKAKELTELKIIELWNNRDQDREEFKALCSVYFDIASILEDNFELKNEENIYEWIKIISFGYLGEHHHFVREFLVSKKELVDNFQISEQWNNRILITGFKAIVYLVIKQSWKEIELAIELINQLRGEQQNFENKFLNTVNKESRPYGSAEIVSLYHFAKTIEVLGQYLLEGRINGNEYDIESKVKYHLSVAKEFASASGNIVLEMLYKYFEAFSIKLARNTIWYSLSGINHWVTKFNRFITHRENKGIYELLYPQRSILKGELFNSAYRSLVISLPTSSGKTLIAEYKILQALNEFRERGGWVAYIVPTKALVNQIYIRLYQDLGNIGLKIEKASGVAEIDGFESYLVENQGDNTDFDVLITTYEKLHLLVRQGLGTTEKRPLVLTIVDEAHNLEERQRGLNLEMLLATIKNDCCEVNFILLTPDIPNAKQVAEWLGGDRSKSINIQFDWWQPNERVIGALRVDGRGNNFNIYLQTLNTIKGTYKISEKIPIVKNENAAVKKSEITQSKIKLARYVVGQILNIKSPVIVLSSGIDETFHIADYLCQNINNYFPVDEDVELLKKFVQTELGNDFPPAKYLDKRIAIHSSAISDEIRSLIELLMAEGKLQVLVATTTIAQGINFPVSAVVMGSNNYPFIGPMPTRDFWNLAGRVGRIGQQSMGWIGVACRNDNDLTKIADYVEKASADLLSQLESAIEVAMQNQNKDFSRWLYLDERWSALLQYISHLRLQIQDLNTFISRLEEKLNSTLGFRQISDNKKEFLISKLRQYAENLSLDDAKKADSTGFSTISIRQMIDKLSKSEISLNDWQKSQLFSEQNQTMRKLVGIMLSTYEIRKSLEEIKIGNRQLDQMSISRLIINWVNGENISQIAQKTFPNEDAYKAVEKTTKAIYKVIANMASWGMAALQKIPTSGINWDYLSDVEKKKMMNIPAYLLYGVNTDEGVLMRKANVPRSIANQLGALYKQEKGGEIFNVKTSEVNEWLNTKDVNTWNRCIPANSKLSGEEYLKIWKKLNNIGNE